MIAVTAEMSAEALLFSVIIGIVFGGIYTVISAARHFLKKHEQNKANNVSKGAVKGASWLDNLIDFLFFFIVGIVYILVNYAICDGVILIYPLVFVIVFFLLSRHLLSKIFKIC